LCHRCGFKGAARWDSLTAHKPDPPLRGSEPEEGFTRFAAGIWKSTAPITAQCIAGRYLIGRGCRLPPAGSNLKWISLKYPGGGTHPAIVGLITHVHTCEPLGLHRTFLRADGSGKADVETPKQYLCRPVTHGVVRIWPDDAMTIGLGIAEGIENALSSTFDVAPVWACL
jgi:hypothetical protein